MRCSVVLILISMVLGALRAEAQWTVKAKVFRAGKFYLSFPEPTMGYALSLDTLRKTTDGGESWEIHPLPANTPLARLVFTDPLVGYAMGRDTMLYKSTNGGMTWEMLFAEKTTRLNALHFHDNQHGMAVGDSGAILSTSDGGATWRKERVGDGKYTLTAVQMATPAIAYAAGNTKYDKELQPYYGMVFKTVDGGTSWQPLAPMDAPAPFTEVEALYFLSADTGYVSIDGIPFTSTYPSILKTTDGGATWEGHPGGGEVLDFVSASVGCVATNTAVTRSTDGGEHWDQHIGLPSRLTVGSRANDISSVHLINDSVAICAVWSELDSYLMKLEFGANPASVAALPASMNEPEIQLGTDAITIAFNEGNSGPVALDLVDMRGASVLRTELGPRSGASVEHVALPPLPKGAYVIHLTLDGRHVARKVILGVW